MGACSTLPCSCYKVEYLSKVTAGVADAVCKTCQRASGKALEEQEGSSSSGSSSSTEVEDIEPGEDELEVPVG
jgi:hypothetical protein